MKLSELFQVAAIIEKLYTLWRDLTNYLKHKCKYMNLKEFIDRLRIEEDNEKFDRKFRVQFGRAKANLMEFSSRINKKRKCSGDAPKRDNNKNAKKFKGNYYNCGKAGHRASECCRPKKNVQVNAIEEDTICEGIQEMNLFAVISKRNSVGNPKKWWVG